MVKKILPAILGAVVAVGLVASAQAATIKIKVKCNTSVDWPVIGIVEYPGAGVTELGGCSAGGSFKVEHDVNNATYEVLVFAESEFGGFCWIDPCLSG